MKLEFSQHIFEECSNIKFLMKIRPVGAELLYADRHDDANSRFSQILQMRPTMRVKCHSTQSALLKLQ